MYSRKGSLQRVAQLPTHGHVFPCISWSQPRQRTNPTLSKYFKSQDFNGQE